MSSAALGASSIPVGTTYIAEKSVILFGFFLVFLVFSSITFSCYVAIGYLLWRRANNMASNLERKTCLVFFTSVFSYYVLYMPGIIVNYLQAEDLAINVSNVIVHANFLLIQFCNVSTLHIIKLTERYLV